MNDVQLKLIHTSLSNAAMVSRHHCLVTLHAVDTNSISFSIHGKFCVNYTITKAQTYESATSLVIKLIGLLDRDTSMEEFKQLYIESVKEYKHEHNV